MGDALGFRRFAIGELPADYRAIVGVVGHEHAQETEIEQAIAAGRLPASAFRPTIPGSAAHVLSSQDGWSSVLLSARETGLGSQRKSISWSRDGSTGLPR